MTRWCAVGVLLVAGVIVSGCSEDLPEGTIAQVGEVAITRADFDTLKAAYEAAGRAPEQNKKDVYKRFEQKLAEHLVNMEILRQRAPSLDVLVTDGDVQAEITKLRDMFGDDDERFNEALEKQGLTLELLRRSLRENLLLERVRAAVTSGLSVTDEEAEAYYETHKSDYVHQEERDTRHILISPFPPGEGTASTASQADWEAAQAEAEKVRGQIQNGADFSAQAHKFSDDETTRDSGGDLGIVVRGQVVPAFEEAVFSLKKGELSLPVRTQYGYHLIEVTDIIPEQQLSFEEVSEEIKTAILERKQEEAWQAWLLEQEAELNVEYQGDLRPERTTGSTARSSTTSTTQE